METPDTPQPAFSRKPSRYIRSLGALLRFAIAATLIASFGFGTMQLYKSLGPTMGSESELLLHVVQRRTLDDTVVERGTVESQNTVYGKCELPGDESSIVSIVPEGTVVSKGDVIVKLESSKINQQIALKK